MAAVTTRPTAEQYQQALDYYRTGTSIETIGERLDLDPEQLEQLEHEGWPALDKDHPPLAALRAEVLARLTRIRAGELDVLAAVAESAAKTSTQRARTSIIAAQIESAIVSQWGRAVTELMRGGNPKAEDLCMPKAVLDNLRALRGLQDPDVDRGFVDIFVKMGGREPEGAGGGDSLEDAIVRYLVGLTPEEQTEYAMTGKLPKRQQELQFKQEETAA